MTTYLDHTIVPVKDRQASVDFYTKMFSFDYVGEVIRFLVLRVNENMTLDFAVEEEFVSNHYAFSMDQDEFDATFARVRDAGLIYGHRAHDRTSMQGPGMTNGAKGLAKSIYFEDLDGHILEIRTY